MSRILGLPCSCTRPAPTAGEGEVVIYYGGWDFPTLRACSAGKRRMRQDQERCDEYASRAKPGYYRLNFRVPGITEKTKRQQISHLRATNRVAKAAPVTVAATALLVELMTCNFDLLSNAPCPYIPLPTNVIHTHGGGMIELFNRPPINENEPFSGAKCRCKEMFPNGERVGLMVNKWGRLSIISIWEMDASRNLWLASSEFLGLAV